MRNDIRNVTIQLPRLDVHLHIVKKCQIHEMPCFHHITLKQKKKKAKKSRLKNFMLNMQQYIIQK